jgi:hypothetical protein
MFAKWNLPSSQAKEAFAAIAMNPPATGIYLHIRLRTKRYTSAQSA